MQWFVLGYLIRPLLIYMNSYGTKEAILSDMGKINP